MHLSSQVDTKLKAQASRSEQARSRALRLDGRVHEVHIGCDRLLQMLSNVPISQAVAHAPPVLSTTRKGGGSASVAAVELPGPQAQAQLQPAAQVAPPTPPLPASVGGAAVGDGAAVEPAGAAAAEPPTAEPPPATETQVTLTLKAGSAAPTKGSAAAAAAGALTDLRRLAAVEDAMPSGASRCIESAVAALHSLAAIEHRLGLILPEIQRSDARTRLRQASQRQSRADAFNKQSDAAAAVMSADLAAQPPTSRPSTAGATPSSAAAAAAAATDSTVFLTQPPETALVDAAVPGVMAAGADAGAAAGTPAPLSPPPALRQRSESLSARDIGLASRGRSVSGVSVASGAAGGGGAAGGAAPRRPASAFAFRAGGRERSASAAKVRPVGDLASMPNLVAQLHQRAAHENNVRIALDGHADRTGSPGFGSRPDEATERDRQFLWRVFQAFDQNRSGSISLLEVRALFDRVALEESLAARGEASSGDRMLRAASKFITTLFDEDGDGKLGKAELDQFFHVFNSDASKQISWDEFEMHGSRLLQSQREREEDRDEAKEQVRVARPCPRVGSPLGWPSDGPRVGPSVGPRVGSPRMALRWPCFLPSDIDYPAAHVPASGPQWLIATGCPMFRRCPRAQRSSALPPNCCSSTSEAGGVSVAGVAPSHQPRRHRPAPLASTTAASATRSRG